MVRKRSLLACVVLAAALGTAGPAAGTPIVINDTFYGGQNNGGSGGASQANDVIGSYRDFDVQSITFTQLDSSGVTAQIRLNYHGGDATLASWTFAGVQLQVGDLLFGSNGQYQYGVALVNHDGLQAGALYQVAPVDGTRTSDFYLNGSGLYWRFDTDVRMNPIGATFLSDGTASTVNVGFNEVQTTLSFVPGGGFWSDLLANGSLDVHFGSAICANDVIDGTIPAPVPVPASVVLMVGGIGLGAGTLSRYRTRRHMQSR